MSLYLKKKRDSTLYTSLNKLFVIVSQQKMFTIKLFLVFIIIMAYAYASELSRWSHFTVLLLLFCSSNSQSENKIIIIERNEMEILFDSIGAVYYMKFHCL